MQVHEALQKLGRRGGASRPHQLQPPLVQVVRRFLHGPSLRCIAANLVTRS
jgi:hypothetical protein